MHKQSFAKKFLAMFLAGTMAALGCVGTPESERDVVRSGSGQVDNQSRQRVSLEFATGNDHAVIELERVAGDDVMRGTMTVTGADGIPHIKDVEYPVDAAALAPRIVTDDGGARYLDVEGQRLVVTQYEKTAEGVDITFLSPDGVEFHFSQSGTGEFFALPAAVVLGIVGIGVCGLVILASITACAIRDRCWDYSLTGGLTAICTGSCKDCDPTPSPTASVDPEPTETATASAEPTVDPTVEPTETVSVEPSESPSEEPTGSPEEESTPVVVETPSESPTPWETPVEPV
jgi:hypothetical protein